MGSWMQLLCPLPCHVSANRGSPKGNSAVQQINKIITLHRVSYCRKFRLGKSIVSLNFWAGLKSLEGKLGCYWGKMQNSSELGFVPGININSVSNKSGICFFVPPIP